MKMMEVIICGKINELGDHIDAIFSNFLEKVKF